MHEAKHENSRHVRVRCVRLRDGALVDAVEGHAVRHFREDPDPIARRHHAEAADREAG